MCDCYSHKCELCERTVEMHIADYNYPREDFRAWCDRHVDDAPSDAVVFTVIADDAVEWGGDCYKKGYRCAIAGPNVGLRGGNHPNLTAMKDSTGADESMF